MFRSALPPVALAMTLAAVVGCRRTPPPPPAFRGADIVLPPDAETIGAVVPSRVTLDALLRRHDIPDHLVTAFVAAARGAIDLRQLRAGHSYTLVRTIDGLIRRFEYHIDADRFLRIRTPDETQPATFDVAVVPYEKRIQRAAVSGVIDAERPSLVAALDAAGEDVALAIALADIFSGDIDFNHDLQRGDRIEVLVEKIQREGAFAGYGPVLAAAIVNSGRAYRALRFRDNRGRWAYYDEHGRSLRRFFLRSPLRFEPRVTSGFSHRRLHPVLGTYRAHLGVDYHAPTGAPVVAVADGTVVSAGVSGGSGRMVRLRHAGGYESYYLHLSAFAKGIQAGARVGQGQPIGRVGASGLATGPHLDYRLRRNGVFINPLRVQRPPGDPIAAGQIPAFIAARDRVFSALAATSATSAVSASSAPLRSQIPQRPLDAIK
jgi:murein DD-endopeptidase MepM/ murein hydrolase activator NlpD